MVCLGILVSGEEAICPSNELDDLQQMLSMEEGEPDSTESESEPDRMDFVRAISLDQFWPLSLSTENAEDSLDEEGSRNGEQEQREKSNDVPTAELRKPLHL